MLRPLELSCDSPEAGPTPMTNNRHSLLKSVAPRCRCFPRSLSAEIGRSNGPGAAIVRRARLWHGFDRHVHLTAEALKHSSRSVSVARGSLGASLNRSFRGPRREFQNRSRSAPAELPRTVRAREDSRHVDGADGLSQCFAINYVDCPPALRVFGPSPEKYSRLAPDPRQRL